MSEDTRLKNRIRRKCDFDDDEVKRVIEEYKTLGLQKIAKKHNTNYNVIREILIINGIEIKPSRRKIRQFTEEEKKQIVKLYIDGIGIMNLASMYSIDHNRIREFLIEAGVNVSKKGRYKKVFPEDIIREIVNDYEIMSMSAIAQKYNSSNTKIREVLIEAGVDIRVRGGAHMGDKNFTEQEIEDIVIRYKNTSIKKLSEEYHVDDGVIRKILIKNSVTIRKPGCTKKKILSEELKKEIIASYRYMNVIDISDKYSISCRMVRRVLKENGISIRWSKYRKDEPSEVEINDMISEYKSGIYPAVIAKNHKLHPSRLKSIFIKHNVKIRTAKGR